MALSLVRSWMLAGALCLGVAQPVQAETFDQVQYAPPAGWAVASSPSHIDFTATTRVPGAYVKLALYTAAPGSADLTADFKREWADLVQKSFANTGVPQPYSGRTAGGLHFREASADVKWAQGKAVATLQVFAVGQQVVSLVTVASDRAAMAVHQSAVRAFVASLRPAGQGAATAQGQPAPLLPAPTLPLQGSAPSNASAGKGASTAAPAKDASGIVGVWMTFRAYYPSYDPRPRWYVFFADGQVLEDMPRTGLQAFDREASKAQLKDTGYWGTYTYSGGAGKIARPTTRTTEAISQVGADKIKIDSDTFTRSHSVDGVRLQGTWTSYANPNDPAIGQLPQGRRPVFHFSADGRFVDEGVFATYLTFMNQGSDEGGSGTYEARDHSMVLRYSDGRVKQVAFAGMLGANPATQNDILFFGQGGQFNKRK